MKTTAFITFRKQRELGQIIGDTYKFLRHNTKGIFQVFAKVALLPFLLLVGAVGFYTYTFVGGNIFVTLDTTSSDIGSMLISALLLLVSVIIYSGVLYGMISEYIKAYMTAQRPPDTIEVVEAMKTRWSHYSLLSLTQTLGLVLIAIVCAIPGGILLTSAPILGVFLLFLALLPLIYFAILWFSVFPVYCHKPQSLLASFNESAQLIKPHWWMTLFTVIVQGLLMYVISFVFQLPLVFYSIAKIFILASEGDMSDPNQIFDGVYITLQTLASAVSYLLYIIMAITANLIYFNVHERATQQGSLEAIDHIGA